MKKILLTIFFVLISSVVYSTDFDLVTVTNTPDSLVAADTLGRDTSYSDILNISDWTGLSWNWFIQDEANKTSDSIIIWVQTSWDKTFKYKMTPTSTAAVDSIAIGAADTTRYVRKVMPKDSLYEFIRFMVIHSGHLSAAELIDSHAVDRSWFVQFYCEDINR